MLFVNNWLIDVCINIFKSLTKEAFKLREVLHILILSHIQQLMMWYLSDSLYSADNLKAALKKTFISNKSIFNCFYVTEIEAKLSFSVIIILKISFCIFINYNEVEMWASDCGMC